MNVAARSNALAPAAVEILTQGPRLTAASAMSPHGQVRRLGGTSRSDLPLFMTRTNITWASRERSVILSRKTVLSFAATASDSVDDDRCRVDKRNG